MTRRKPALKALPTPEPDGPPAEIVLAPAVAQRLAALTQQVQGVIEVITAQQGMGADYGLRFRDGGAVLVRIDPRAAKEMS